VQPSIGPYAGFTLVESMLTLAIMSMGLLALAGLQITALRGNDLSRRMTTAVAIAEQSIEQLKNRTIRSKAKLLLHGMKSLCYGDPSAFNIEAFGHQEEHRGLSLACGDSIQTD
jgi:prepilin-type N-terminal cleavage/methylation domain-containing protein